MVVEAHVYRDVIDYVKKHPQCAIATGVGKKQLPPLFPIPVQYPFQIIGVVITLTIQVRNRLLGFVYKVSVTA